MPTPAVWIGPGVAKVALPGYDVTTATMDQLAFDARFASMRPVERGILNQVLSLSYSGGDWWPNTYEVGFQRNYPSPPTVIFAVQYFNQWEHPHVNRGAHALPEPPFNNYNHYVWATVYTTYMRVTVGLNPSVDYGTGKRHVSEGPISGERNVYNIRWMTLI